MALESATYIDGLVTTNPTGADAKSTADDHLRLIKSTVKATFPNITGAVTPTHTELNFVDGVTSAIQTQIDTKAAKTGEAYSGVQNFTGATLTAATPTNAADVTIKSYVDGLAFSGSLPAQTGNSGKVVTTNGTIASWTGSLSNFALTNPTITNLVETVYAPAAGSAFTVDWANGTIQKFTTNANVTITLPAASAGKGGVIIIVFGGTHTVTFAGGTSLKYSAGTAPTATSVNGKKDVYAIVCHDATETLVQDGGRNF